MLGRMDMPFDSLGEGVVFSTTMSDYKIADGVPFAFEMSVSLGTDTFMTMKLEKVTHGIEVDDALFAMPKE